MPAPSSPEQLFAHVVAVLARANPLVMTPLAVRLELEDKLGHSLLEQRRLLKALTVHAAAFLERRDSADRQASNKNFAGLWRAIIPSGTDAVFTPLIWMPRISQRPLQQCPFC